ncbi:uncharacterized protein LY89DRAFT_318376 [Mollisia scopiformis]|uniref:Zn(2)-C6 fungal-type domain-containing protein n=1 Tax=Mollisia scopiformis TaxID=149040 RepID=A0A132BBL2_MOLSC|nr:uncharacterized protein LY89DRAFT_318376 [Mollisia scopiformis]KUJ09037.1 hypothetical protein LY89DRAFT_318376 [Mollisia scopiformis]
MSSRKAACDPCRQAKVACDHGQPVCRRCQRRNKASHCVYRVSPFRRVRIDGGPAEEPSEPRSLLQREERSENATPLRRSRYPNPGHLGSSSHVALFDQISYDSPTAANASSRADLAGPGQDDVGESIGSGIACTDLAQKLEGFLDQFRIASLADLVKFWLAKGVNLALAEPIVLQCTEGAEQFLAIRRSTGSNTYSSLVQDLLKSSAKPLVFGKTSTLSDYTHQFCGENMRLETLGIFLIAVIRASIDIPFFPPLYATEAERHHLRQLGTAIISCTLELCLSLDCLNDLQLIFQYEHWILMSYVYGDQSYGAWRKLGDVIASIYALGYHENIEARSNTPPFLTELRKTVFARAYSGDKNVAIFLGRPPRMSTKFAYFQIPSARANPESGEFLQDREVRVQAWDPACEMNYRAETRWSALCAFIKEDILELLYSGRRNDPAKIRRTDEQWQALPAHFRLEGKLNDCITTSPFERDFLLSTRLNHLQVKFLLQFVLLDSLAQPDEVIVTITQQMLSLVVEGILLRDQLANSGTGFIWKIVHYGLPAAGIILLAMLKQPDRLRWRRGRVWQDFTILVAEVQMGSFIREWEPDYALLSKATQTIQRFLDISQNDDIDTSDPAPALEETSSSDDWFSLLNPDPWHLEMNFWSNLGEHSFLSNMDPALQAMQ